MIRLGTKRDIDAVVETYDEHFAYEKQHTAYTVFQKGVYPTRRDVVRAVRHGSLYIAEWQGKVAGSMIADTCQPAAYGQVDWQYQAVPGQAMVLHLLLVRPAMSGHGVATALVRYVSRLADETGCTTVRLDTGVQNRPALQVYTTLGYTIAATGAMKVGDSIFHRQHVFLEKPVT